MKLPRLGILHKLLLIAGGASALVLSASALGFWLLWNGMGTFQTVMTTDPASERAVLVMVTHFKKQAQGLRPSSSRRR